MKKTIIRIFCLSALVLSALTAQAENYVNWGKGYYVTVPDGWRQIERFNVDNFLRFHGNDPAATPYDAFFCPKDASPFYSKAYVFVYAEEMENSIALADSIRIVMEEEFDKMVNSYADSSGVTKMESLKPVYDSKNRTITMISNLKAGDQDQSVMLVIKFYNKGMATFYCYTTSELFDEYQPFFEEIRNSFRDENLEGASTVEPVKIAQIENTSASDDESDRSAGDDSGSLSPTTWVPFAGLAIVLIVVISRKRRAQKKS